MTSFLRFLSVLAVWTATLSTGCSSGGDGPTACQALTSCCASLGVEPSSCTAQATAASAASDSGACGDLLASYVSSGLCGGSGKLVNDAGPTFDPGLPLDAGASGQASICARYLTCVGSVDPSELPTSLAAYGASGACWSDGTSARETCITACTEGVATLHSSSATSCPLCTEDSDCGSQVCSSALGECVECTSDAQCGASHCDVSTNTCVACIDDADCMSGAPHCNPTGTCVACTDGLQCASGTCNEDETCCEPKACAVTFPGDNCGLVPDECGGMVSCGSCSVGYCDESSNTCSSVGLSCTSGGDPSQCGNGTVCAFDAWHQAFDCAPSVEGQPCATYPEDTCSGGLFYMSGPVDDYTCVGPDGGNGTCGKNCLTNADCASGQTCVEWDDNAITTQLPGQCQPPM